MTKSVCAFSGHRQINISHGGLLPAKLSEVLDALIESGVTRFLSGGAMGFDLIAADAVLTKRDEGADISLSMYLPCLNQSDRWGTAMRHEYSRILSLADEVIYISKEYTRFCMHERNRRMVDDSEILLCYLTREVGGTANTKEYAQAHQRKIINIEDLL